MISSIFKRLTNYKKIRLHNIKLLKNQDDVNEKRINLPSQTLKGSKSKQHLEL
jgi:hypothetical protein